MNKLLLCTFVFALCSMNSAATFYIDRISGADGNDGLSPATAWQNVEKVNAATFSPGDSILFKRGQVWFNTLKITANGTKEQPVFFGTYGAGGKPRFNAQDLINHAIYITNASYVRLRDLVAYDSKNTGIPITYSHHILLRRVDVLFSGDWEQGGGPGITVGRESHHVVIDSATVIKSVNNGIYTGSSANQKTMVNNVTISNSYSSQTKFNDCIVVHEGPPNNGPCLVGDSIVFRNNYAELSGNEQGYDVTAGASVFLENNISYGNPQGGVTVGHSAKNVVIKNHISYGEPTGSPSDPQIQIGGDWGTTSNYEISGCLFLHTKGKGYMLIVANKDVRVFNNTFIWSGDRGDGILVRTPADSVVFKNNIFTTRGDYIGRTTFLLSGNPMPPRFVFDNNIYFPPDNFMFFNSKKTKFYGFEEWQTAMQQDSHSIAIDPQLVDIAAGDYRLLPTSPAIDTLAADIRIGQRDILGTLIPYGDGPDVGAVEYTPELAGFHVPVPGAPTELTAANNAPGQIELTWTDNSDNEFGFRIDRAQDGKTFEFVDIVDPDMTSYTDTTVTTEQQQYQYHVRAYNNRGNSEANTASIVTAVQRRPTTAPSDFRLYGNYPNPFNPSTNIAFDVPESGRVVLAIYNVLGEKIVTLVDSKLTSGRHDIAWDANDETGVRVSSGIYFYKIQFEAQVKTGKMIFMQ